MHFATKDATPCAHPTERPRDDVTVHDLWVRAFGPKARKGDRPFLHMSVGLRRLTRFCKDVATEFDVHVPPTAVMRLGTADAVAEAVRRGRWPESSPLLLLREGAADQALVIVSAGSGLVLELCDLALLIDFPGQIWGLQLPGLDGECAPLTGIAAIARHYADAIVAAELPSPCHVIGYSFGGLVAVEVARLLRGAGRDVGLLGIVDTTCYERYWPRREWLRVMAVRTAKQIRALRVMPVDEARAYLKQRCGAVLRLAMRRLRPGRAIDPANSIYFIDGLDPDFQRVRNAAIVAWETFRPKPYDGRAVLFQSALGDPNACDPAAIWRPLIDDLTCSVIPGSHVTIVRKVHAATLADAISGEIRLRSGA